MPALQFGTLGHVCQLGHQEVPGGSTCGGIQACHQGPTGSESRTHEARKGSKGQAKRKDPQGEGQEGQGGAQEGQGCRGIAPEAEAHGPADRLYPVTGA